MRRRTEMRRRSEASCRRLPIGLGLLLALALAGDPAGAAKLAIVGGRVVTMAGRTWEDGVVLVDGEEILDVGGREVDVPVGFEVIDAARILGIEGRYGSLEKGKVANLVLVKGDIFQPLSEIKKILIRGQEMPLVSRQTEPRDRFSKGRRGGSPLAGLQHLVGVAVDGDGLPDPEHRAVLAEQEGLSGDPAVFPGRSEGVADDPLGVGDQGHGELVLLPEGLLRGDRVLADPVDGDAELLE
jgi:hypothetical protein